MQTAKKEIYGNCIMLSPEGEIMCRCEAKKMQWYVSRNLADVVGSNPITFKLRFQPKGDGSFKDDIYNQTEKENRCVVCGRGTHLTRHHCVPFQFRQSFPVEIKTHSCHDVLIVCDLCHVKYEPLADEFRNVLAKELGLPPWKEVKESVEKVDCALMNAHRSAWPLVHYGKQIPENRKKDLMSRVSIYLGHEPSDEELTDLAGMDLHAKPTRESIDFGKEVVNRYGDLQDFTVRWRKHFIISMEPRFMPKFWDVERPIKL